MSEDTESPTARLACEMHLPDGVKAVLTKLERDTKNVTFADNQSSVRKTEAGDIQSVHIVAAVKDIANRDDTMQAAAGDGVHTSTSISDTRILPERVIDKLKTDPASISTEDTRRFSENVEARDARSARLISAVESLAAVRDDLRDPDTSLGQTPHTSLLTVVRDLLAAVENCPEDVDVEILETTQGIVSKMQKAIGHTNAPHPELEPELQQQYARIMPKVERGTISQAEVDHLHSLEARAHGYTERGGLAATAQSIAAKFARQLSTNSSTNTTLKHRNQSRSENEEIITAGASTTRSKMENIKTGSSPVRFRRNQSLSDQTNTLRGSIEGHALIPGKIKGLTVRYEEKDSEKGSGVSYALPTSFGAENSRHKREKSQV